MNRQMDGEHFHIPCSLFNGGIKKNKHWNTIHQQSTVNRKGQKYNYIICLYFESAKFWSQKSVLLEYTVNTELKHILRKHILNKDSALLMQLKTYSRGQTTLKQCPIISTMAWCQINIILTCFPGYIVNISILGAINFRG